MAKSNTGNSDDQMVVTIVMMVMTMYVVLS